MRLKLLLAALCALLVSCSNGARKAPFSLALVPSTSHSERSTIAMADEKPDGFYVVLTNISTKRQPVWEDWNSWGYQTISFVFTAADGKSIVISKRPQLFTKNHPSLFLIPSGEHQVYAIRLDKAWSARPLMPKAHEMPISVKAVYEVSATPEARHYQVWSGRVESRDYDLTLRQW
jgi:hypothetical protein